MTSIEDDTELLSVDVPLEMVEALFEPWDGLDSAIAALEVATRTHAGPPELIAAVIAAREALRIPVYAVMREYQAVVYPREPEE